MEQLEVLFALYFATLSVVVGTTLPFAIELINRVFDFQKEITKSIVSWVIPVVVMYVAWGANQVFVGFLTDVPFWHPLVYGVWSALMANIEWNNVPWLKEVVNQTMDWLLKQGKKVNGS